jgi:tRNA-dihydrouridine synthase C
MLEKTGCHGLMIGRGAVTNPWIFHEIKEAFGCPPSPKTWEATEAYIRRYADELNIVPKERTQINKLKQMVNFLFKGNEYMEAQKKELLRQKTTTPKLFLEDLITHYQKGLKTIS